LKKILIGIIIGFVTLYSNSIDYEKMCTQTFMQKKLDIKQLHTLCTYAAESYKKKSVLKYMFFNILSGKYKKNFDRHILKCIKDIKSRGSKGNAYLLIGHSYILDNKMKQAQKYYSKAVPLTQFSQRFYHYLKLPKLYPDKQDQIKRGNQIIKRVYQKRDHIDRLIKDIQHTDPLSKKEFKLLTQLLFEYQKTFHTSPPVQYEYMFVEHLLKRKKYKEAIKLLKKQSQTKNNLKLMANAYIGMGAYMDAIELYKKILNISNKSDKDLLQYNKAIANCYTKLGNYKVALSKYKKALKLENKNNIGYSYLTLQIGNIYQKLKEYDKALYYYQNGLNSHHNIVSLCFAKSEVYLKTKQIEKISDCYYQNASWIEKNKDDELFELKSVMQLYQLKINSEENPEKDISLLEQIFLINKRFHPLENDTLASLYNTAGSLYLSVKQYQKSLKYYKKALVILKQQYGTLHEYTLTAYNNVAYLYSKLGQYKQAEKYFKQILLKDDNIELRYSVYINLCDMYRQKDKTRNINKYCILAKKLEKKYPVKTHKTLAGLVYESAAVFFENSESDHSLKYYKKALETNIGLYGKNHILVMKNFQEIAKWYQKHQLYTNAYHYALLGFKSFNERRIHIFTGENRKQKKNFLHLNRQNIVLLLITGFENIKYNSSIKNQITKELLNAWLNYKGSIFDSENTIATLYANTKDKALKEKIEALSSAKRTLAKLYQSLPKPTERKQWQESIKQTKDTIDTLTKKIASKAEKFKEEQGLKNISYQDISSHLKKDELYIDFAKAGDYYYVFTLDSKANITFKQIDENSTKKIDSLVKTFREDIDTILNDTNLTDEKLQKLTIASKEKLSKLYSLIAKPIQKQLQAKQSLIISPDGALKLLPFEALYDKTNDKYLIEQKDIRYIPSGKELVRLYRYATYNKKNNKTVIFDNPNFNATTKTTQKEKKEEIAITPNTNRAGIIKSLFKMRFSPLPGTKAEAQSIKQTLKKDKVTIEEYKENQASEDNLLKVKQPNILHIATHGFFINDNTIPNPMLKSGIALSGANTSAIKGKSDGIVTALKLSGLKLKGTDLVVLSACQTGVVDINSTDSVSGLSKAFIQAGAKDIVMSLWSVNDQATKELMSSFYKEIATQPNYSKALKEAKLKMIHNQMHPFFWAPFVVSGL